MQRRHWVLAAVLLIFVACQQADRPTSPQNPEEQRFGSGPARAAASPAPVPIGPAPTTGGPLPVPVGPSPGTSGPSGAPSPGPAPQPGPIPTPTPTPSATPTPPGVITETFNSSDVPKIPATNPFCPSTPCDINSTVDVTGIATVTKVILNIQLSSSDLSSIEFIGLADPQQRLFLNFSQLYDTNRLPIPDPALSGPDLGQGCTEPTALTLDDDATLTLPVFPTGSGPYLGKFHTVAFALQGYQGDSGADVNGTWELFIRGSGNYGTLVCWSLTIVHN